MTQHNNLELKAPRQVLFALILMINFILTAALLVYSLSASENLKRQEQGELLKMQLSKVLVNSVSAQDTVGLSLITTQYAQLSNVNSIRVIDNSDKIISEVGNAVSLGGDSFVEKIMDDDKQIGSVNVIMNQNNLGTLVKSQWIIFVGSALLHIILLLIYNLIARQFVVRETIPKRAFSGQPFSEDNDKHNSVVVEYDPDQEALNGLPTVMDNAHNSFEIKSDDLTTTDIYSTTYTRSKKPIDPIFPTANIKSDDATDEESSGLNQFNNIDHMRLNIQFDDPKNLLPKLTIGIVKPYFKLCDLLLEKAIDYLTESPLMPNKVSFDKVRFSAQGVTVTALSENKEKAAYACFLLGQLYLLLHQVTFQKHIEIQRFALQCKACVCNNHNISELINILDKDARANDMMLLLNTDESELFKGVIEMKSYHNPKTVLQRNIGIIDAVDQNIVSQITLIRDKILGQ